MKFLKTTLIAMAISTFAMSAQAQDTGVYVNLGAQTIEFDTGNVLGRIGYNFNEYFGVEAEGSIGVFGDSGDGLEIDVPYTVGGFAIAKYPITKKFDIFGRVGYSFANLEAEGFGEDLDLNIDGIGFGGGVQYSFDGSNGIRLGYTYQTFGDDSNVEVGDASVIDLSYVHKF